MPPSGKVSVVDDAGRAYEIPEAEVEAAIASGFRLETPEDRSTRVTSERKERVYGGVIGTAAAGLTGALRGATLGLSDVVYRAGGAADTIRDLRDVNPVASIAGEVIGGVAAGRPGVAGPAGAAARLGERVSARLGGSSIGGRAAGIGVEGAIGGAGAGLSEIALSKDPVTLERAAAALSSGALLGGAAGAALGGGLQGASAALARAKRALDAATAARQAAADVPEDLAALPRRALDAEEQSELARLQEARKPEREALVDELRAHRERSATDEVWKSTAEARSKSLREITARNLRASKALGRSLDDPKKLADNPGEALSALRVEEAALAELDDLKRLIPLSSSEVPAGVFGGHQTEVPVALLLDRGVETLGSDLVDVLETATLALGKEDPGRTALFAKRVSQAIDVVDRPVRSRADDLDIAVGITPTGRLFAEDLDLLRTAKNKKINVIWTPIPEDLPLRYRATIDARARQLLSRPQISDAEVSLEIADLRLSPDDLVRIVDRDPGFLPSLESLSEEVRARVPSAPPTRVAAARRAEEALARNRDLQRKIGEAIANPESPRLDSVRRAKDALSEAAPESSVITQVAATAAAAAGPLGLAVSGLTRSITRGRLRAQRAVSRLLGVTERAARSPTTARSATKTLTSVRFSDGTDSEDDRFERSTVPLRAAFARREGELRAATSADPSGQIVMRPEARAKLADSLGPIREVDPVLADRIETIAVRRVEYLSAQLPRVPEVAGAAVSDWKPSEWEIRTFARRVAAVEDPDGVVERLADARVTPIEGEALRAVYPELMAGIVSEIFGRLPALRARLPYAKRLALSLFSGATVEPSLDPRVLTVLQSRFSNPAGPATATATATAPPSRIKIEPSPGTATEEDYQ